MILGKRRKSPAARGGLSLLVGLLLLSAALRVADGAGAAMANGDLSTSGDEGPAALDRSTFATAARAVFDPDGIAELLDELSAREEALSRREEALDMRLADLEVAEQTIRANLAALTSAEQRLEATLAAATGAMEEDLARLTRVYESMKPRQAATLFEQMDPTFAAGFLARMAPDAAAGILAGLSPEAAYRISVLYAGRHGDVPQN